MSDAAEYMGGLEARQAILNLPFVEETKAGQLTFWNIEGVGCNDTDIALGEHCAGMALSVARQFGDPLLVAMVLRDMINDGKFTGVEAGFIAAVASAARVGSYS